MTVCNQPFFFFLSRKTLAVLTSNTRYQAKTVWEFLYCVERPASNDVVSLMNMRPLFVSESGITSPFVRLCSEV